MTINLTKTLKAKQAESKLSNEALAKAIGVSTVSVAGVLKGKSKPNKTTAKKYASYLGLDVADLASAKAKTVGKKKLKLRSSKPGTSRAKAGKRSAKAGRKPLSQGLGTELAHAVNAAAGVLNDRLALAVHKADKTARELIARLLGV